eukprot:m.21771 g.21771  ORF g.21771 m.21771 type:complete len:900 (+) comp28218_c1_seq2:109-2808(+)
MGANLSCVRLQERPTEADYQHFNLTAVPDEIFGLEKFLQVLLLDYNAIKDLPKALFNFTQLIRLGVSDNEIETLSCNIANLTFLEEFDISRNGIADIPDDIRNCKNLRRVDFSVNPIGRLPDGFTHLTGLKEVCLNDIFLENLPDTFGRLNGIQILELRENQLTTLPRSMCELKFLKRLDLGNNHFEELSPVIGNFQSLQELWLDCNALRFFPNEICLLNQLRFLDASENLLEALPRDIHCLEYLEDLHLNDNQLRQLPENFGGLVKLSVLKLENNQLLALPRSIGNLVSLSEFCVSQNHLQQFPHTIGFLHSLATLIADSNKLMSLPPELGSCQALTVLSLRDNNLQRLPKDIGRLEKIVVLALSGNRLENLPCSLMELKSLSALWLSENQAKPLIPLQNDRDPFTGDKILTCFMFPQTGKEKHLVGIPRIPYYEDTGVMSGVDSKRNSTIMFNIQEEPQRTASNRSGQYPKDVVERHPHHHAPLLHHSRQQKPPLAISQDIFKDPSVMLNPPQKGPPSSRPLSYLRSVGSIDEGEEADRGPPLRRQEPPMTNGHLLNNAIHMRSNPALYHNDPDSITRPSVMKASLQNVSAPMEEFDQSGNRRRMASDSVVRGHRGLPTSSRPLWPEEVRDLAQSRQRPTYMREKQSSLPSLDQIPFRHQQHLYDHSYTGSSSRLDVGRNGHLGPSQQPAQPQPQPQHQPHHPHRLESPPPWWSSPSSYGDHLEQRSHRDSSPPVGDSVTWDVPTRKGANGYGGASNPMVASRIADSVVDSGHGTIDAEEVDGVLSHSKRESGQGVMFVDIVRDPHLGFSISGGYDSLGSSCRPEDPGIFVTKLASDGPAARAGRLQVGDKILEVNGMPVLSVSHKQAIEALKKAGRRVHLKVERLPQTDVQQGTLL